MNKMLYPKLAINDIKKNGQTYMPYMMACIGTIMMFYNMCFLAVVKDIGYISDSPTLRTILSFGAGVIGFFSVIFLFYTNSFLIKRRKKEFGLFNILGMEKKHIARIMFFETVFIALISIVAGVLLGILLSKLIILLLFKIVSFEVTFGFEIPLSAVLFTIVLFNGIFALNLIYNICQVHLAKPVELLKGGNVGEKEPRTKWLLACIGAICLGTGYYIALTEESPLMAMGTFFIAVILVIIGTYCLFIAGSIAILKILRKNKRFYYKAKHFISVSSMIYRMKQNAAGLASICILSTAVIIMLSTTVSMYVGLEDVLRARYPRNIIVQASNISDEQAGKLDAVIAEQTAKANIEQKNVIRYRAISFSTNQNGESFTGSDTFSYKLNTAWVYFLPLDEYNRMEGRSVSLANNEALLYVVKGNIKGDILDFNGYKLSIKERLASIKIKDGDTGAKLINCYYVIVNGPETIKQVYASLTGDNGDMEELSYYYGFDVNGDKNTQIDLTRSLSKAIKDIGINGYVEGPEIARDSFYSLYGGLFFLGLFLGLLFIMATVLIIYYKQITEGYDDRERFEIMQKVGLNRTEIKKFVHGQVLTVFFLPLFVAVIHLAFAFKVITKLLSLFNLTNIPLFAACMAVTVLVFAIFYTIVYELTATTYYKIVS